MLPERVGLPAKAVIALVLNAVSIPLYLVPSSSTAGQGGREIVRQFHQNVLRPRVWASKANALGAVRGLQPALVWRGEERRAKCRAAPERRREPYDAGALTEES